LIRFTGLEENILSVLSSVRLFPLRFGLDTLLFAFFEFFFQLDLVQIFVHVPIRRDVVGGSGSVSDHCLSRLIQIHPSGGRNPDPGFLYIPLTGFQRPTGVEYVAGGLLYQIFYHPIPWFVVTVNVPIESTGQTG
jgi:hypothetical protein